MARTLEERKKDEEQFAKGKRFRLDLEWEFVSIVYGENEVKKIGISFPKIEDNGNVFYLSNQFDCIPVDSSYFNTLKEMQEYITTNPLGTINIWRNKNDFDNENIRFEYQLNGIFGAAFLGWKLHEGEQDEQVALNHDGDEVLYPEVIIVDKE